MKKILVKDTESFISASVSIFGEDRFDYSKVNYVTAKTDVDIRCIKHDLWFKAQPYLHRLGDGCCPECCRLTRGQYNRLTIESFTQRSNVKHNNLYDYSKVVDFQNAHTNVTIVCPIHGEFIQSVNNHLYNGFGCPTCSNIRAGLQTRLSQEEVIYRFTDRHKGVYDYAKVEYDGIYVPVKIYCKEHNNWFLQKPIDHFSGSGCKLCISKGYSRDKAGYLYINKVGNDVALKIGITNVCPIERAKVLSRKSRHTIKVLYYFFHEDGSFIADLEKILLSMFPTGVVPKSDMKSGYTETISSRYLPEVIDTIVYNFNEYVPK